jgi:hypothetical protein
MATWLEGLWRWRSPEWGGGDSGGGDNPGGGCGTPVTGQDEKQKGGAREVLRRRASRDGGRKKWSAVVSTAF